MRPEPRVKTYVGANHFMGKNWCAKCGDCGKTLTRYCFTEEEARREGENALAAEGCRCG